jgi:hypothetical protein
LARFARDIAAASEADARTTQPEVRCDLEHLERRAQSTARAMAEQLGAPVEAGEDEIDVAMSLIVDRLLAGHHAAPMIECSSALAA